MSNLNNRQILYFISVKIRFVFSSGNSVSEVYVWGEGGGGGGGAKLHEFPTKLRRFARFTNAYCFTKTTLGQHIGDAIQHVARNPF